MKGIHKLRHHKTPSSLQGWLSQSGPGPSLQAMSRVDNSISGHEISELNFSYQAALKETLQRFDLLFQEPTGLPPSRLHDHGITLFPNQGSVCVRPYRYPYHQKVEIESQVQELLQMGVIHPSKSAFSSPVILVK